MNWSNGYEDSACFSGHCFQQGKNSISYGKAMFPKRVGKCRFFVAPWRAFALGYDCRAFRALAASAAYAKLLWGTKRMGTKKLWITGWFRASKTKMVPPGGFEPSTNWLRVSCSTDWATEAFKKQQLIYPIKSHLQIRPHKKSYKKLQKMQKQVCITDWYWCFQIISN